MNTRRKISTVVALALGVAGLLPAAASAAAPHWTITSTASPAHLIPGDNADLQLYGIVVTNTGGASTTHTPITITDTLPPGVTSNPNPAGAFDVTMSAGDEAPHFLSCDPGPPVTCTGTLPVPVYPGARIFVYVPVLVDPGADGATVTNQVSVSGGGAATATATEQTPVSSNPAGPGFQSFDFGLTDSAGAPVTQAGSHPYDFHLNFHLNTVLNPSFGSDVPAASIKDATAKLPPGLVVNPAATPTRCTEAQLETGSCPDSSAAGLEDATVGLFGFTSSGSGFTGAVFNTIPPPGVPAQFAFNAAGIGIFIHLSGGVDTAGDYALTATARDILQYGGTSGLAVDLWGDPSDPSHDHRRSYCAGQAAVGDDLVCPVPKTDTPLLSMPSACSGPLSASLSITSWEDPANPFSDSGQTSDSDGAPVGVSGCSSLDFKPTLKARPTTNVADSPSGLDVDLHVPQTNSLSTLATSNLKKAVVTLPEGLVVNPSGANGLDGCSAAQIGLATPVGSTPIHFTADPATCPDAAKIGTVEVDTPLLDDPLPGAVYIAKPHDNPFDSLLAIYIVVNDPATGVVVKLAGHVVADPDTGRLTTTFDDNPELPFSDFKLSFFGGAGGTLRTPVTCGNYSTTSELTPWSGNAAATPHDDYAISQGPGGSCAASEDDQPNSPSFDAGTVDPIAGAFSPFVLSLNREDGTQQFSKVTVTPPPGLVGKLAGTPACSEAALAAAANKTGQEETANPSCPAASQVGTVGVAAGAGPSPFWAQGKVYMAGPYKGAPLSFAIVTPATAGPFDLGTVVVRTALSIDPSSAQITATSDPIPTILEGINLDVRSARLKLDKPNFTLNGTSCDKSSVTGQLVSTLDQTALLSNPFQLAECGSLGFKPALKLSLKGGTLRNGHPAFTSVLTYPQGDYANLRKAQVTLPPSMQLDQSHIQAPCTRPQFAADQCPDASIIGSVTATSPLLDYDLTGPAYLRTGNNPLPDIVLALHGPPSQPIEIDQVGKVDTVNARLRTTFESVPDAPLSKAVISLVGGSKGLLVNNTNLCKQTNKATVLLDGQNSKVADSTPKMAIKCPKPRKKHHKKHKRNHHHHQRHSAR